MSTEELCRQDKLAREYAADAVRLRHLRARIRDAQQELDAQQSELADLEERTRQRPRISWANVLNTALGDYGTFEVAGTTARNFGYPFFTWNGWVYPIGSVSPHGDNAVALVSDIADGPPDIALLKKLAEARAVLTRVFCSLTNAGWMHGVDIEAVFKAVLRLVPTAAERDLEAEGRARKPPAEWTERDVWKELEFWSKESG